MNLSISPFRLARNLGDWRGNRPAYLGLAERIRLLLLDGRLIPGTRLPAERELAATLSLSRNTVAAAYAELRATSHADSIRGSGTHLRLPGLRRTGFHSEEDHVDLDFRKATPAAYAGTAEAYREALQQLPHYLHHSGYDAVGLGDLRAEIAQTYTDRGISTTGDQILVTVGAVHAWRLIVSAFVSPGERVLIEQPTYPPAVDILTSVHACVLGIPVDANGWDIEVAEELFRRKFPTLAYLMPDFHNPTGSSMSNEERRRMAQAADAAQTMLVADETTALLDIDRGPRLPLSAYSPRVVSIGSMSKTAWGGLRIGWIRAAPPVLERVRAARGTVDMGTPLVEQLATVHLLRNSAALLASRSEQLRAGRDHLRAALGEAFPQWTLPVVSGGLSLWIQLGEVSSSAVVQAARPLGLALVSGPRFGLDGSFERYLRLPFTQPLQQIDSMVHILQRVIPGATSISPSPGEREAVW